MTVRSERPSQPSARVGGSADRSALAVIEGGPALGTRPDTTHRRGGLLWQRNFRLLWIGETVSAAGNAMAVIGTPLLAVTVLHATTFAVSALTAAAYLPWLIIGLPAGAWADRLPVRPTMITCDLLSALLYASLPIAALLGVLTTVQVVVVALLAGAVNVMFTTAYQILLPSLITPDELAEGNAKLQGSASLAAISGRSGAGLAAEAVGAATAMSFNAGSFLVSAACVLLIRTEAVRREPGPRTATMRDQIAEGVRFIVRDPFLRPITIYAAVANLAYTGSTALLVLFLVRVAGFSPAATGLLLAAATTGGVLGALVARRLSLRLGTARALLLSALTAGLFSLMIPLAQAGPRAAFYIAGAAVAAAGIMIGNIIAGTFRQAYCPAKMLGRITASMRFLVFGTIPLGALLAGGLGSTLGVRTALWVILAIYALSGTLLLTPAIVSGRNLPGQTPATEGLSP
jgi:MFS family permease